MKTSFMGICLGSCERSELRAEVEQLQLSLGQAQKSAAKESSRHGKTCAALELAAADAHKLRKAIDDAPHGTEALRPCNVQKGRLVGGSHECNCWKRKALEGE